MGGTAGGPERPGRPVLLGGGVLGRARVLGDGRGRGPACCAAVSAPGRTACPRMQMQGLW
ncbi:hypothetical protein [Actinomadura sp. J1-007]|uniref:hypothetical protein n=1 Tax=Actinomadura sp. J1-007 TaxID=2661913 RepID=UPI001F500B0B|nr:hypothetical protein [Actinomadura sp. J1-007]